MRSEREGRLFLVTPFSQRSFSIFRSPSSDGGGDLLFCRQHLVSSALRARGLSARSFYDAASPPSRLSLLMRCLVSMLARQSLASLQHSHIATTCINRAGARELTALLVRNGA